MFLFRLSEPDNALFFCRLLYVAATFTVSPFLYFTLIFFSDKRKGKFIPLILTPQIILIGLVVFSDKIIQGVQVNVVDENIISFGSLYCLYAIFFISYFSIGFIKLYQSFCALRGQEKAQVKYVFWGYFVAANVAMLTNLILPWFGFFELNWLGQVVTLFLMTFTVFAIVKYNLFKIKIFVAKLFTFLILAVVLVDVFLAQNMKEILLRTFFFLLMVLFGYMLIKTTRNEIEQRKKLDDMVQDKIVFSHMINHQIREPLSIINNYLSLFEKKDINSMESAERKKYIEVVISSAKTLKQKTHDLLFYLGLEKKSVFKDTVPVDLVRILSEIRQEYESKFNGKSLTIKYLEQGSSFKVRLNKNLFKEALANIFDNIYFYSVPGEVEVRLVAKNNNIKLQISNPIDQAIVDDEHFKKKVTERFGRGEEAKKLNPTGTGLGVSIVKRIVERSGGKFEVEVNKGRFTVVLVLYPS